MNNSEWGNPNDFFMTFRCMKRKYARPFFKNGRIIINTDRARIKELLKNPIEIGSIEDISQYCDQYFYDGIRVIIHADVVELPERHTAKQQGKISGMK